MIYPDPANRYCCSSCREPIPDVDTISNEEAERRQRVYISERQRHRNENPPKERRA